MDRQIKAFLILAEELNVSAAAERLGLTQPSVAKLLKRLEEGFGTKLFRRLPRGLALTPSGKVLLDRARASEREYRDAREEVAAVEGGYLPVLRVGAGPLYHLRFIPKVFEVLVREFPRTCLDLVAGINATTVPQLLRGELHVVVGEIEAETRPHGVDRIVLLPAEMGIMVRRGHPLADARLSADALAGQTWVVCQQDDRVLARLNRFFLERNLPAPNVAVIASSFATALQLVARSDYLMIAPAQLAPVIEEAGLRVRTPEEVIWRFQTGIWVRHSSRNYPIVRRFIEIVRELTTP